MEHKLHSLSVSFQFSKFANFFSLVSTKKLTFFIHTQKRDSSYDFSNDAAMKRMRDNNKDFDFVTESPFSQPSPLSRVEESPNHGVLTPREVRVSFYENLFGNGSVRCRSNLSTGPGLQDEVVLSTSSLFRRKSHLLAATRTKSRLMDLPEQDQRSQKITMKSGIFSHEDLPEKYKKMKFNLFSVL